MAASPPRRRLIGLSTKTYLSFSRTRDFTHFVSPAETVAQLKSSPVPIWPGAQDCHWDDRGAFTGEVTRRRSARRACASSRWDTQSGGGHSARSTYYRALLESETSSVLEAEGVVYGGSPGQARTRLEVGQRAGWMFLGRFGYDPERFVKTIHEVIEA
ncbi:Triosephosphate isomerase [Tolypocladium paradoxum]|uniref:Triosephosphate isomerase n=1 Tax=Tolypocladium paradoxum TaxID=94208 RepID=A0A2S4LAF2_9HYPO|nr:Triosephosphate isomerase [Tolypocladium paradoxum]